MTRYLLFIFLSCLFFWGCGTKIADKRREKQHKQHEVMDKCMDNWKYKELDSTIEVKILLFIPAHHTHILFRPNFAFCVYHDKDTFAAIIDYHYDLSNRIKDGDKITLISPQWDNYKTEQLYPPEVIFNIPKENSYYCAVKTVYYASIK